MIDACEITLAGGAKAAIFAHSFDVYDDGRVSFYWRPQDFPSVTDWTTDKIPVAVFEAGAVASAKDGHGKEWKA